MTSVYDVSLEQMEAFAELGYIVLPKVVPRPIIEVATRVIEDLRQREPPPPQGNHAYWLKGSVARSQVNASVVRRRGV